MDENQIEKKDDAKPVEIKKKSKKRKAIKANNPLDVDGGDNCVKVAGDQLTEQKINLAVNENEDVSVPPLQETGNMGNDGNVGKKRERESTECNSMSTEKAQIEGKEKGPLEEPDCDLESRKKKKGKHEVHQKELGNENVSTPIEITENENVVAGKSNVKSTVKRRDVEDSQVGKLKKVIDNRSEKPESSGKSKKVRFSGDVEVSLTDRIENMRWKTDANDGLVRGIRFTPEEDKKVKEAVLNYIEKRGLGKDGLTKLMNSRSHREELKNCWKEIGCCLPHRPYVAIYYRAHILFERAEKREWTEEEIEFIQKSYEKHGNNWKMVAEELGKHRVHVKDKWRRIKNKKINSNKGKWTQEEYQNLYDLVNVNMQTKVFCEEKNTKHGMLRDDIPWGIVSKKIATRSDMSCYNKWYGQLTSSLVAEDKWSNADDYRLISALYDLDAACEEDVDWDALLEHRPGDICKNRWDQMVLHIGHHGSSPFSEQVEILSKRYCPELAETREAWDNKPSVPC